MADRRRRPHSEGESEEESTETSSTASPRKPRQSECESEGEPREADIEVSDYESANEDNEEEEEEEEEESEEEEEEEDDDEYEDEDVIVEDYEEVGEERQSGDGEEQPDNQKLDDDEDRKNPAFIPRQGAFYEHDLRIGEDGGQEEDGEMRPKKKLWQDEGKWYHDRYSDNMQGPKSREELITMYGYDIRMSDKPPDAPPRRGGGAPRRPRYSDKSRFGDFIPESRDDSYIVDRKNDYNRNRDRYYRGKSEEFRHHSEDQGQVQSPPPRSNQVQEQGQEPEKFEEWNSRYEENQSYRGRGRGGRGGYRGGPDGGFRGQDSGRGYGRSRGNGPRDSYDRPPRRDYNSRYSPRDYDNRPQRDYDNRPQRDYDNRPQRDYDRRPPRYDRNYQNEDSYRGGRYNNRGYRQDSGRREYTSSRGRGGGFRSRPDRGGPSNRRNYEERKIPPRFLKKKEAQMQQYGYNYSDNEHGQQFYETYGDEYHNIPAEQLIGQHVVIQTEVYTPSNEQVDETSAENVEERPEEKNDNLIVQSSTSEKKSYSKERRVRSVGKTRTQYSVLNAVEDGVSQMNLEGEGQDEVKRGGERRNRDQKMKSSQGTDTGRTKRYSSQRQRNPDPAESQPFYPNENTKGFTKQPVVSSPPFQQPIPRPVINFPIPVSTGTLPNGPPQRLFRPPPPGSIAGPVPLIPPQFVNAGVIYGAPTGPGPFPVAPIQGFPSPPPVSTAPSQQIPPSSAEVYRHGTTYYPPELQYPQMKKRSPAKRTKSAIPIVNPEEVVSSDTGARSEGSDIIDDRDAKLQETIDREFGFENQIEATSQEDITATTFVSAEGHEEVIGEGQGQGDDDLDTLSSRLTTDMKNYTIAFTTEQEVEKGDNLEEKSSPIMKDEKEDSPSVNKGDNLEEKDSSVRKEENTEDRNSPVNEVKDVVNEKSSPMPEVTNIPPEPEETADVILKAAESTGT